MSSRWGVKPALHPRVLVHAVTTVPTLTVMGVLFGWEWIGSPVGPIGGSEIQALALVGAAVLVPGLAYVGSRLQWAVTRVTQAERDGRLEPVQGSGPGGAARSASSSARFEVVPDDANRT